MRRLSEGVVFRSVIHNECKRVLVARAVVIEILHLLHGPVVAPSVIGKPPKGTHIARPVTPAGAMDEELSGRWIVGDLQESFDSLRGRIRLVLYGDVDVFKTGRFRIGPLVRGILSEVD